MIEKPSFEKEKNLNKNNQFDKEKGKIIGKTKEKTEKLNEEVLNKMVDELNKILKYSNDSLIKDLIKLLPNGINDYKYLNKIDYENLPFEIEKILKNYKKEVNIKDYNPKERIEELKEIFKGVKNSKIYEILNKENFTKEDIVIIYLAENLFFHFSGIDNTKKMLSENERKEFEENGESIEKIIEIFQRKGIQIFFKGINTESDWRIAYKIDKDFKSNEINLEKYLPMRNKHISEIFNNFKEKDKKAKVHFLKANKKDLYGTIIRGNVLIFRKNIKNSFPNATKEDLELFEKEIIKNEGVHDFLEKIGFRNGMKAYYIKSFYDLLSGREINTENARINNSYIHEFLSDYGSFSGEKISQNGFERIIQVSFSEQSIKEIGRKVNLSESYAYTRLFHKNIIEKILGKKLSDYELYKKLYKEHLDNFNKKSENIEDIKEKYEIYLKEFDIFGDKIQKSGLLTKVYNDLKAKEIDYNGQKVNGLEYLKIMNQKQGEIIIEEIYKWYKNKKQKP